MQVDLSAPRLQALIWTALDDQPGRRPTVRQVAAALGQGESALRRSVRRNRCTPMRDVVTWACLTYAGHQICRGLKIEAAMRLAGFRNKTNFVRQCREFLGCDPRDIPRRHPQLGARRRQ